MGTEHKANIIYTYNQSQETDKREKVGTGVSLLISISIGRSQNVI